MYTHTQCTDNINVELDIFTVNDSLFLRSEKINIFFICHGKIDVIVYIT